MVTILETLTTYFDYTKDPGMLTEFVRVALSRQITGAYVDSDNVLSVITVDPEIENLIRGSIHEDPIEGRVLGLDPDTHNAILSSLFDAYQRSGKMGFTPVFLVSPQIRSVTFALLEREIQAPAVIAYNEISRNIKVNVVASALLSSAA
jgi:flagellar biosynthesis protein FlhA